MGLLSAFGGSSRPSKPVSGGSSFSHASHPSPSAKPSVGSSLHGKITRLEIKNVHRDLVSRLGRAKGERAYAELLPNMDRDRGTGSSGISASEVRDTVRNMERNPYDGLDKHDAAKVQDVLNKRLDS